jgi:hypothetical protein
MNQIPPMTELEALILFAVITDALDETATELNDHEASDDVRCGTIVLAEHLLRRVWPLIDQARIGDPARRLREAVASTAATARRRHGWVGVQ